MKDLKPAVPMVEGGVMRLADGKDWVVPPLAIDRLIHHLPVLAELGGLDPKTPLHAVGAPMINNLITVVGDAMRRNYPELTDERVAGLLDIRTLAPAIGAALNNGSVAPQPAQSMAPSTQAKH